MQPQAVPRYVEGIWMDNVLEFYGVLWNPENEASGAGGLKNSSRILQCQAEIYSYACHPPQGEVFYHCGLDPSTAGVAMTRECHDSECLANEYCVDRGKKLTGQKCLNY